MNYRRLVKIIARIFDNPYVAFRTFFLKDGQIEVGLALSQYRTPKLVLIIL